MKLVDILVFTNGHGRYLKKCILSLNKQTFKNFNVKLFNNHRNNIDRFIINLVDDYYHCPKIKGPSALRNFGINKANSKYITIIDGDDFWNKEKLKFQLNKIKNNPQCLVYTNIYNVIDNQLFINKNKLHKGDMFLKLVKDEVSIAGSMSSVMIKKNVLSKLKNKYGYIFDQKLNYCEDFDFFIRISTFCKFQFVNKPLVYINNYNTSHQSKFTNIERSIIKYRMINKNLGIHIFKNKSYLRIIIFLKGSIKIFIKKILYLKLFI